MKASEQIALTSRVIRKSRTVRPVFWAANRHRKAVVMLDGSAFPAIEHVRAALAFGIMLPDGSSANSIGRCKSEAEFRACATHGGWTVLETSNETPATAAA
jgi:hypothetical protein